MLTLQNLYAAKETGSEQKRENIDIQIAKVRLQYANNIGNIDILTDEINRREGVQTDKKVSPTKAASMPEASWGGPPTSPIRSNIQYSTLPSDPKASKGNTALDTHDDAQMQSKASVTKASKEHLAVTRDAADDKTPEQVDDKAPKM